MKEFILASASPRRREILTLAGYDFDVIIPKATETFDEKLSVGENIERIAYEKALSVFKENKDRVVFGCDTVVQMEGRVYTKPKDRCDAESMLKAFSGKSHFVTSGMCFLSKEKSISRHISTQVIFKQLDNEEIEKYLDTDEPWDKAGAYAIQGRACVFIEGLKGCYYNVMGLPIEAVYEILRKDFGISPK